MKNFITYNSLLGITGLLESEKYIEEQRQNIIVWNRINKSYTIVDIYSLEAIMITSINNNLFVDFHEVITIKHSQKIRFDIDGYNTNLDYSHLIQQLIYDIYTEINKMYGIIINLSTDVIICTSTDHTKYSYHIIIDNYAFDNYSSVASFCIMILNKDSYKLINVLDRTIYGSNQNFRLLYAAKDGRVKTPILQWIYNNKIINTQVTNFFRSTLITYTEYCKLLTIPDKFIIKKNVIRNIPILSDTEYSSMLKIINNWMEINGINIGYSLYKCTDNRIKYIRKKGVNNISPCVVHNRVHENDNIEFYKKDNSIFYKCFRGGNDVEIWQMPSNNKQNQLIDLNLLMMFSYS